MRNNPFCPSFSLKPDQFFGRISYLDRIESALANPNSPERYLLLTGTRGCGKTSLLHQYALRAKRLGMDVVESTGSDALAQLKAYVGVGQSTVVTRSIKPSVSVNGIGGASLGELTHSVTADGLSNGERDQLMATYLCNTLSKLSHRRGLMLTVDEVQKISENDMVIVANAVQSAITRGYPIAFVVAGLPSAYRRLRRFKRCTFLQRMRHDRLWCMDVDETLGFMKSTFSRVQGLVLTDDQIWELGEFSGGHPYLMQLVGYHLCELVGNETLVLPGMQITVEDGMLEQAKLLALRDYKENVLDNVLSGTRQTTREYIRTAYEVRLPTGEIKVRDINSHFGKSGKEMASRKTYALDTQVLKQAGSLTLRFALPHYRYLFEELEATEKATHRPREWQY